MKIIISQQDKKISVVFKHNGAVDSYKLDKADDFLNALDKFMKKHKIDPIRSRSPQGGRSRAFGRAASNGVDLTLFQSARLEIKQASLLTERIIRAIMQAISWQK